MQAVAVPRTCKQDQQHITYHIKELPRSYKGFGRPQVLLGSSLFMLAPIRKRGQKYGYSYKWTKEKMQSDLLYLPVTTEGSIDYHFMETYINAIKKECIARLKRYIEREHKAYKKVIEA